MTGQLGFLLAIQFGLLLLSVNSEHDLCNANNAFAIDLYKRIGSANNGKNVFFSPISILLSFGLVGTGASGETKEQIQEALHQDESVPIGDINEGYKKLLAGFKDNTSNYTLHMVNGIFVSNNVTLKRQFLLDGQTYFDTIVRKLNFVGEPDESRLQINEWVAEQTDETIRNLLPDGSITTDTILLIANAIYFNALWANQFDSRLTAPGPFWISGNQQQNASMMFLNNKYLNYYNASALNCEVLELPYQGHTASMFIFLPHDIEGLHNLEKLLTARMLADILRKLRYEKVDLQLPKFEIDASFSVKQYMEDLGAVDVFNATDADLSGISSGHLFVGDAIHQAFINVSETGTVAAAATAIFTVGTVFDPTPPIQFTADRPFMFFLYEKTTQTILFWGRLVRPPTSL